MVDISSERIKIVEWHKGPTEEYFNKAGSETKFADRNIPDELKFLLELK